MLCSPHCGTDESMLGHQSKQAVVKWPDLLESAEFPYGCSLGQGSQVIPA